MEMVLLTALGIGGATIVGAVIGFCVKNVSHKVNDMILSFAAGIMLAAAVNGLIAPAFELVSGAQIAIPVIGIFIGALFLNFMDKQENKGEYERYVFKKHHKAIITPATK